MSGLQLDIQIATQEINLPNSEQFLLWAQTALISKTLFEITLRLVEENESQALNNTYRQKPYATNVLTFPAEAPLPFRSNHLGDIVICAPRVTQEAHEQHKAVTAHWAHLVVHSVLHLQGYDHQTDADALIMESLEIDILQQLGFPNPYGAATRS